MATIRRRGEAWQVQIRRTGQRPISRSFLLKKDAETWARHMEVQADRRDLPVFHDPKALNRMTLAVLVERYRDTISARKRGGAAERYWLNAFLRHPICRQPLSSVCTSDFAAYRDERLKTIKPSTLKRQLAPIHNLFEVARAEWGLPLKENPLAKLSLKPPHGGKRERRLKPEEWDRLAQAAHLSKNPNVFPIIVMAIETGMRRGEILGMLWDHLDRANACLFIPHTKNGHSRTIPLTKAAWEILDAVPKFQTSVFPTNANAFRLAWVRVLKRAEIRDLRFHGFLAGGDRAQDFLFDENAPPHPLKATTLRTQKTHVRCAASALVRAGLPASGLATIADVCSPSAFRLAIENIVAMRGGRIGGYVMGLAWTLVKLARFSGALPQNEIADVNRLYRRLAARRVGERPTDLHRRKHKHSTGKKRQNASG